MNPNPRHWNNPGSTCPIKCANPEMGEHFVYDNVKRKVACPSCLCSCTDTFESSSFQYITVAQTVEKSTVVLTLRNQHAKSSSGLMATILSQPVDAVFKCASNVMTKNGIVMSSNNIHDDMFDRAVLAQVN